MFIAFELDIISIFFQEQYISQHKHITQMLNKYLSGNIANIVQLYTKSVYVAIDFRDIKYLKETIFF
jgi:hypothetical protein